jgi:peroxiredoxin
MANQPLSVGDVAPDFTLKDQTGNNVTLGSLRGQKVVLSWHPLAWTGVCAVQMKNLEERREDFESRNAVALGMSVDTVPSKKAWAEDLGVQNLRLLSDFYPHGQVAQAYGVFNAQRGFSERAVFVLDEEGVVQWKKVYPLGEQPDIEEILEAVDEV